MGLNRISVEKSIETFYVLFLYKDSTRSGSAWLRNVDVLRNHRFSSSDWYNFPCIAMLMAEIGFCKIRISASSASLMNFTTWVSAHAKHGAKLTNRDGAVVR